MAYWSCGHRRASGFADYPKSELYELCTARFVTPAEVAHELALREMSCPACSTQAHRHRRHWSALALAIVLALLVLAAAAGAR